MATNKDSKPPLDDSSYYVLKAGISVIHLHTKYKPGRRIPTTVIEALKLQDAVIKKDVKKKNGGRS